MVKPTLAKHEDKGLKAMTVDSSSIQADLQVLRDFQVENTALITGENRVEYGSMYRLAPLATCFRYHLFAHLSVPGAGVITIATLYLY